MHILNEEISGIQNDTEGQNIIDNVEKNNFVSNNCRVRPFHVLVRVTVGVVAKNWGGLKVPGNIEQQRENYDAQGVEFDVADGEDPVAAGRVRHEEVALQRDRHDRPDGGDVRRRRDGPPVAVDLPVVVGEPAATRLAVRAKRL